MSVLSWIAAALVGIICVAGRARRASGFVVLLVMIVSCCLFLLGSVESATRIIVANQEYTALEMVPYMIAAVAISARSFRTLAVVFVATTGTYMAIGIISYIIGGADFGAFLYSLHALVSPMLLGACTATLDEEESSTLAKGMERCIMLLSLIALMSVPLGHLLARYLGWMHVPSRIISPVGSAIGTAGVILLIFPKYLADIMDSASVRKYIGFLVIVGSLLLSGSRAVLLAACVAAIFIVGYTLLGRRQFIPFVVGMAAITLVAASTVVVYPNVTEMPAIRRLGSRVGERSGDRWRLDAASVAQELIVDRPIAGSVPGHTYQWFRTDYSGTSMPSTTINGRATLVEPHNLLLFVAVEYGLLGVAALLVLIGYSLTRIFLSRRRDLLMYGVGISAYLLQTVGSTSLAIHPRIASIFWVWLGTCTMMAEWHRRRPHCATRVIA